jgi:hypothetical protein
MIGKFGSDQQQLADLGGGVISEDGATLLSGESTGEASLLFGPAALREIQSNVANGDFSIPPADAEANITADNGLPYWTGVQTGTAPTVSAAITTSAVTASQSALTFTVEAGAATNSAYTFTRYVPIAGNANRSSAYHPEVYSVTTTGGAGDKARVRITLTATAVDKDYAALTVTATANETASTLTSKSLFTNWIVPDAKAAYILVSVKVDVPATAPVGAVTVVIGEVRVARSEGSIAFPALQNPSGQPWIIENDNLILEVYPQTELDPTLTMESNASTDNYSINLSAANANGVIALSSGGYVDLSAPELYLSGNITGAGVTTDLHHGITLQRTTNLTVNTSTNASATAITWSSAVKDTSLYAYWSSGSTISIPLDGWYSITCHLISGTGLGTGFAFRLYALVNGTVIAETETQAGANTTSDTFSIATIAYMTAADSLVFRASASSASKTIGGSRRSACSVVYLGNTSA